LLRLAAYLRDSGGDRQEASTDRQHSEILEWAANNRAVIAAVYRDEARPGSSTVGREAFLEMIHAFRSPACDLNGLVIWSWSRFARDIDDAQFYRADLRRRGFELHSVVDPIPEGPMGRFIEAAIDWKNQQFLIDLSKDVRSGLHNLVLQHGCIPGTPPKGFIRQPVELGRRRDGSPRIGHRWVPDPELIPLVRLAFEMKAAGATLREISQATGLFKPKHSWIDFFTNKIYMGVLEYGGNVIEHYCEPIVSPELWDACQPTSDGKVRNGGSNHPRRARSSHLLSGLLRCGRCGSAMSGHTRPGRPGSYYCARQRSRRDCDLPMTPAPVLERAVLEELKAVMADPIILQAERDRLRERFAGQQEELAGQLAAQRQRLAETRRQIGRLTDAIAESGHSRALLAKLTELERDETACQAEISRLEHLIDDSSLYLSDQELADLAARNRRALEAATPDQLRQILRGLVKVITVDRDGRNVLGSIEFFYPPGQEIKKK